MTTELVISETFENGTTECIFGESDWYEPFTDDLGRLYRSLQSEYGRCTGHVYISTKTDDIPTGWVFEKRMEYEDADRYTPRSDRTYIRRVWVNVGKRSADGVTAFNVTKRES